MKNQKPNLRKKVLINQEVQYALIKSAIIIFLIAASVMYTLITVIFAQLDLIYIANTDTYEILQLTGALEDTIGLSFLAIIVLGIVAMYFYGIRVSHKIVGPLYRIQKHFEEINQKSHCRQIKLRDDDFLQNFAKILNLHIAEYQKLASWTTKADIDKTTKIGVKND